MGILGTAWNIGSKVFKGLRARRKAKKLDRKKKKATRKELEAQKALSALIVGGTGQTNYSQPLDGIQEMVFPEVESTLGGGGGKIFKPRRGLNRAGIASSFTEGETVLEKDSAMGMMAGLKALPIWAKVLGVGVLLWAAWKLFIDRKKRRR